MTTTVRNLFKSQPRLAASGSAREPQAKPPSIVVGHLHRRDFAITIYAQGAGPGMRLEMYTADMPR